MITGWTSYPDQIAARRAIEALRNAGVPDSTLRLLSGGALRDVRTETVGGFGGPVGPHARVRTFANGVLQRCGSTAAGYGATSGRPRWTPRRLAAPTTPCAAGTPWCSSRPQRSPSPRPRGMPS
jgi:hypothetical protein